MSSHIAFANETGQVYVAGPNASGQLSLGTTTQTNTFALAKTDATANISGIIQTSVGSSHTLMLRSTGSSYSCGLNTNGQLGLGTTTDTSFSQLVLSSATSTLGNITSVAAGASHSLFLLSDGSALACGLNTSSQLGDSTTTQRTFPVNVLRSAGTFLGPVASIAGGASHSAFATTDGSAWCCGLNTTNQLGDGTTTLRAFATQVKTGASTFLGGVLQVAAGESHSLALTSSGTVFGWGRNNSGQLAIGTTADSVYATQCLYAAATPMTNIISITSHSNHSLFLTASGTVFACGLNSSGQLGDGTLTNRSYPVAVSTAAGAPLTDVISIGTAGNQSYFIKADGRVFACGYGQTGGLGNGAATDSSYAIAVFTTTSSGIKSYGYSAAYWKNLGFTAANLAASGYTAYELVNAGYNKTEMANASITIANIIGDSASLIHLYRAGYSHNDVVNASNKNLKKIGQLAVGVSKIGTLMSGGILDAPRGVSVSGRTASSISVNISAPTFSTGLTGYSVQAVPVTGGSTVTKSLGPAGTLVDGLAGGKIYDLRVRSFGANGNSQLLVVQNSTSLVVPTLTAGSITSSEMTITFSSALAAQDCSYVLRTVPNVTQYVLAAGTTSPVLAGLSSSTAYSIILDASNSYTTTTGTTSASTIRDAITETAIFYFRFDENFSNFINGSYDTNNNITRSSTTIITLDNSFYKFGTGSLKSTSNIDGRASASISGFTLSSANITVNLWYYRTALTATNQWIWVCFNNTTLKWHGLRLTNNGNNLFLASGSTGDTGFNTGFVVSLNTWYHICLVGSVTDNKTYIYINNVLIYTNSTNQFGAGTYGSHNIFGLDIYGHTSGYIDDFALFNNALSSTNVTKLYNNSYHYLKYT